MALTRLAHRGPVAALVMCAALAVVPHVASAAASVAPINSHPHGASYAEWGARWYQWAFSTPTPGNPIAGADCRGGQVGHVWFLHGVLGEGAATRSCRVPSGTALFFPLINTAYAAFLNDPPETRTPQYVRAQAVCDADTVSAVIDGASVASAAGYHVDGQQSPLFEIQLPDENIFGATEDTVPELLFSPVAHAGYYLFLSPLSVGTHTIAWKATGACGTQDISYTIQVVPRGRY